MAWITGTMLLVLVLIAMPLKYFAGMSSAVTIVGPIHGFLYIGYIATALDLAARRRWKILRIIGVLLAGVIPFATFYAEHRVVLSERAAIAASTAR